MKSIRLLLLASALLLLSSGMLGARLVRTWSYQELLDKSDLVVIATPIATADTKEHIELPGFKGQPVIGVETKFAVKTLLKGGKEVQNLILHHYRANGMVLINGPDFISFDPAGKRPFLLFLIREADGRFAPAYGQVDPAFCGIHALRRGG